jgi:hypothetical protein
MCMIHSESMISIECIDNIALIPGPMPPDINPDDEEFDIQVGPPHSSWSFILAPDNLAIMNGPDISAALDGQSLPVPQRGQEPSTAMQEAMEICFIPCFITSYIIYNKWCICLNGTRTAFKEENHTAFILRWLPTKLAEWTYWEFQRGVMLIGGRWESSMPIMPSLRTAWFLERLVTLEPLEPFQLECELYNGKPKAGCYPFGLPKH